jgi:hypothetical protein
VIRDFGIFPEISSRYLDNTRFDDYRFKKIKIGREVYLYEDPTTA